jgi:tRNA(Arg) A34 adenosine deaminase TadA
LQVGQVEKEEGKVQYGGDQAKEGSIHGGWIVRIQHWVQYSHGSEDQVVSCTPCLLCLIKMLSLGISAVTYGLKGSQPEMAKQESKFFPPSKIARVAHHLLVSSFLFRK